jgi:hypothetical protein
MVRRAARAPFYGVIELLQGREIEGLEDPPDETNGVAWGEVLLQGALPPGEN